MEAAEQLPACEQAVTVEVTEATLAYLGCSHENIAFRLVLLNLRRSARIHLSALTS